MASKAVLRLWSSLFCQVLDMSVLCSMRPTCWQFQENEMRIGIDLLYLLPGIVGGTETYASGLLHGLARIDRENKYIVFVNRESADWPLPRASNFSRVVCPVSATSRPGRYFFEQLRLPVLLKRHSVNLVLTDFSVFSPSSHVKTCLTNLFIPALERARKSSKSVFGRSFMLSF